MLEMTDSRGSAGGGHGEAFAGHPRENVGAITARKLNVGVAVFSCTNVEFTCTCVILRKSPQIRILHDAAAR